ncbi:thymidylate synthase [Magnetococcales bacterium HHB-1]
MALESLSFEALHYPDRLQVVNRYGDVGVVTLWSRLDRVAEKLRSWIGQNFEHSRIAVIGNLYGNGLPHLLRNLLWNPQIRYLLVLGKDLSGSRRALDCFFRSGLAKSTHLGEVVFLIKGTDHIIDDLVTPEHLPHIQLTLLSTLDDPKTEAGIQHFFKNLPPQIDCLEERQNIPIPKTEVSRFPSDPRAHTIRQSTPLEAWKHLIFTLVRFGHRVTLKKGARFELQSVKVVVDDPYGDREAQLKAFSFDPEAIKEYQQSMLSHVLPDDLPYTYGHRLRGYYKNQDGVVDSLAVVVERFKKDPETRHAYVSLWDNHEDLPRGKKCPCLVSLFFRQFESQLTMTATFRTHNALDGWLLNLYGLMAIQRYVADKVAIPPGAITVISHSISVAEEVLSRAKQIASLHQGDDWFDPKTEKRDLKLDPHGHFNITLDWDKKEMVLHHLHQGRTLNVYRGVRAQSLEKKLLKDGAISEVSHALYLGRELLRHEMLLKKRSR